MKFLIVNGPNLNLLGTREPNVYGNQSFEEYFQEIETNFSAHDFTYAQSNVEGELIDILQQAVAQYDAVVFNPGGYSHTSVAISDCIAAIDIPVAEVHISNIYAREEYRHHSITGKNAVGVISGFGLAGYQLAVHYFLQS